MEKKCSLNYEEYNIKQIVWTTYVRVIGTEGKLAAQLWFKNPSGFLYSATVTKPWIWLLQWDGNLIRNVMD